MFNRLDESKFKSIKLVTIYMNSLIEVGDHQALADIAQTLQSKHEANFAQDLSEDFLQYTYAKVTHSVRNKKFSTLVFN